VALTAIDRRSRVGHLMMAWTEHLGAGRGQNFTVGRCGDEQGKGDGFPQHNGRKPIDLHNGIRP
jgi:hypothetical protein